MLPHLYHVAPDPREVVALGPIFPITGNAFSDFSAQFGPYRSSAPPAEAEDILRRHLEVAGKAMAYAGLGCDEADVHPIFDEVLDELPDISLEAPIKLGEVIHSRRAELVPGLTDADIIASFQGYLGQLLIAGLSRVVTARGLDRPNLCLSGGCALNIKWNSALRRTGIFSDIWVPPFPNDSGSAIGTACAELFTQGQGPYVEWDVYAGPPLSAPAAALPGFRAEPCPPAELARVLHEQGEPVTVLRGPAELGPRALGHRSILAPASDPKMKGRLNEVKDREAYRPVAPICLEARALEVFEPGSPDPYMLFEHRIRSEWAERVPSIVHLDGTARLQTVNAEQDGTTVELLTAYEALSGIPLLCNTSANHKGSGFFPDVASAADWEGTALIWSENVLYRKQS
jgi:carbamoyltransferase